MPVKHKSKDSIDNDRLEIQSLASQCVKCGICLQSCPTYKLSLNENESPRGRIALMQAIAEEALSPSAKITQHLAQCLGCRTCEKVCPSGVRYGDLYDKHQSLLFNSYPKNSESIPAPLKILNIIIQSPTLLLVVGKLLRFAEWSGLRALIKRTPLLRFFNIEAYERLLPPITSTCAYRFEPYYPKTTKQQRGAVGLFIGCFTRWIDVQTSIDAILVLNALGYDVHVPNAQGCCGAIAQHAGDTQTSEVLEAKNASAFLPLPISHIISTASGCQVRLAEYESAEFKVPVMEICQFILQTEKESPFIDTLFSSKNLSDEAQDVIALHSPCTLKNVLKTEADTLSLLEKFKIEVKPIQSEFSCCGAAGTYMLQHEKIAQDLRQSILDDIHKKQAKIVSTSNIGCAMHLSAGLPNVPICHPVSLIAQKLIKITK